MVNRLLQSYLQKTVAAFLTDRCLIEAETTARGEFGEPPHAWATVASNVPCRVILGAKRFVPGDGVVAGAETFMQEYRLIVKTDVVLAVDQRVTVAGVVYNIVRIEDQLTDEAFHGAVMVVR